MNTTLPAPPLKCSHQAKKGSDRIRLLHPRHSCRALFAAGILVLAQEASAKCIATWYQISGLVTDASGAPVQASDITASWSEFNGVQSAHATSDAEGKFKLKTEFNAYSGSSFTGGDLCERTLEKILFSVHKPGYSRETLEIPADSEALKIDITLHKVSKR